MSQVSYGTITITDTNDIERIYIEYCRSTSNQLDTSVNPPVVPNITVAWGEKTPSWVNGQYIWQRSVIKKTGSTNLTYGTPVCLTGAVGATGAAGRGLTATVTKYCNYGTGEPAANYSGWVDAPPSYDSSKPNYWVKITNTYSAAPTSENIIYKDEALTKAVTDAAIANSIAQQTIEDSQGAMSQAASAVKEVKRIWFAKATSDPPKAPPETGVTTGSASTHNSWSIVKPAENPSYPYYFYCDQTCTNGGVYSHSEILLEADPYTVNALNVRTKNFFHGKDSTYDGWFASGRATSEGLDESNAATYHYNARFAASHVTLGYNKTPVIDLDGTSGAINIYRLPTINSSTGLVTTAGKIGAKLNASVLTFYNTSGTATSTFGDSIALASNGASITVGSTGTGKYNTYIDAQGLYLRTGTTSYATLKANGLVLSRGGVEAGTKNTNDYIYVYSHDDATNHTLAINNSGNKYDWRIIAGKNFGVDKAGNLYANEAHISGEITASKLTISSNATISDTSGLIRNDAIDIGGRNLFGHGSDCSESLDGMNNVGFSITTEDGFKCAHASGEMGAGGKYLQSRIPFTPKPNEVMTISAWVKIKNIVYGTGNPSSMCEFYTGGQTDPTDNKWYSYNTIASYLDGTKLAASVSGLSHLFTNLIKDTNWHKVDFVLKWQNFAFTANLAPYIFFRNATGDLYIRNIKYERGSKATDWTPAPEDAIGEGTNLLYNSAVGKIGGQANKGWRASGGVVSHINLDTSPVAGVTGAVRVMNNGSSAIQIGIAQDGFTNRFIAGELYSQGAWIRGSSAFTCYLQPIWNDANNTGHGNDFAITTDWQYYKVEGLKLLGTQQSTYSAGYFYARNVPTGGWVEVCGMKLERGSKATDWTPAPEDVASDIEDASMVAKNYLSFTESGGLNIGYTGKTERTNIKADGMRIYDSTSSTIPVAEFLNTGAQIGKTGESHLKMDYHSMQLIDKEGDTYFYVSDLRSNHTATDEYGEGFYAVITDTYTSDGLSMSYNLSNPPLSVNYKVYIDGIEESDVEKTDKKFTLATAPAAGAVITATYPTTDQAVKAYTAGTRKNNRTIGVMSFAEGVDTTASGVASHAEGNDSVASGDTSHAEGFFTIARGYYSHAEGNGTMASGFASHAEGNGSTASGYGSHAEGCFPTTASGDASHAQNYGTVAQGFAQTVIGTYNKKQGLPTRWQRTDTDYAFIIGNGENDTDRSNALTVDWKGNIEASGNITSAISACGAVGTADIALSTSEKKITLSTNRGNVGNYLSNWNGGVTCYKSGYVEVSAGIYFVSGFTANDLVHLVIKKNSTNIINAVHRLPGNYDYYSVAPIVYSVSEGDTFYLFAYNQTAARGQINAGVSSWLTVKYL